MASAAGGMEIEQVAAENPDAILKQHIDPGMGLEAFQARKIAFKLGLGAKQINAAVQFLTSLYKAFLDTDASLLEINPFITTTDGRPFALDAKINFKLPIVLRLEGTNVDEGKKILMNSGFNFVVTDTMKDAADKVVAAARGTLGVTEWR